MKFKVTKTSYYYSDKFEYLECSSLEDFLDWVGKQKDDVIISTSGSEDNVVDLEIYDDYRE